MIDEKKNLTEIVTKIKKNKQGVHSELYLAADGLTDKIGSVFKLCNIAARRAVELNTGLPKLVDIKTSKIASVALEEIKQDKIGCEEE